MIAGAHGVRGLIRLRSFMADPEAIGDHVLTDDTGKQTFKITLKTAAKDFYIAELKGVKNKEEADALRGTKLYVLRSALPQEDKGEFYEADLLGLSVEDKQGKVYGVVQAVHNYGGGPFLEIGPTKKNSFMLPFTDACVPKVDVMAERLVINLPEGWLDAPKPKAEKPSKQKVGV
ncbi:MAG: ribosome maturation factor RimM [Alphaproteobacteria bacterium]